MIKKFLQDLYNGKIDYEKYYLISNEAMRLLKVGNCNQLDVEIIRDILEISNILYNNTDRELLPLEDGVYDLLLELYRKYEPNIPVGAIPIQFDTTNEILDEKIKVNPIRFMPSNYKDDFLFYEELNKLKDLTLKDISINPMKIYTPISKRTINTKHKYPKLVGSLDKCKFVMNYQAEEKGVINDSNVKIVERDFFMKHIQSGILDPNRKLKMILELKYDGVSVEADCSSRVISARSRGDADADIATDLTPILENYIFPYSTLNNANSIGVKFEAIMTYYDLYRYNIVKGKSYKNCRTAISGLFSSSDASLYQEFITLVPLETSIEDIDRITEVEFLNKFFYSGVLLKHTIIEGTYKELLFQIKRFVEEAELMRDYTPFMYDGVVISYIDDDLRKVLGRTSSINQFSMAVKFNPLKKSTLFLGYSYTVGQDGGITPMVHYQPVEFFGTIHDKSSLHSYRRFRELELKLGDIVDVEYVNDVMPYVTKPDNSHNADNINPILPFITNCPVCGNELVVSKSEKSIQCLNKDCDGRKLARVVNMMQKLNLKDFSDEYLSQINIYHLNQLMNLTIEDVAFLGPITSVKFMDRINELKTKPIYDYEIVGSLGFTNIGREIWKLIFNKYSLTEIMQFDSSKLLSNLIDIKGIGKVTIETIIVEREYFLQDLVYICLMENVMSSKGMKSGKSVRFTGFRNKEIVKQLNDMGFDASDDAGVTKTTDILLIPEAGHVSSKIKKAGPNTIIIPVNEFMDNIENFRN